jgi:sugar phosphate isomerase/epimerase
MLNLGIACQLYTLRDLTRYDFPGTAKRVADIGYRAVELAGFGNLRNAAEVRKILDDQGLRVAGSHTAIESLERELDRTVDENHTLASPTIVLSFLPEHRRTDLNGWLDSAATLNRIGEACHRQGLELAYHHHHFEFQKFEGQYALDLLWRNTDPRFLKAELDTFWIKYGGEDPSGYLARLGPRATHLHLKDMQPGPERRFGEVGLGILDFPGILAAAENAGVQWGIVEQDLTYNRSPLESLRISYDNLRKLGAV